MLVLPNLPSTQCKGDRPGRHANGYNAGMTSPYSSARISALLQIAVPGLTIEVVPLTGSTNADLLARVDQLRAPVVRVAERQSAGRGRAGRSWHSAADASLTFSLAWRFRLPVQALVGLPLAVGVALAEVLAALAVPVQLKWPNDVLADGRKLAGILIETAHGRAENAPLWAVIGIGINLKSSPELAALIEQPVATLAQAIGNPDVNDLLARILNRLFLVLQEFEQAGFAAFSARWNALHLHRGQQVVITDRGQTVLRGAARGVDDLGRLLIDTAHGCSAVVAGDVSLRALGV